MAEVGAVNREIMYGLAYVIVPIEFASLQGALDETLAPFKRGGADVFPQEKLEFDDVTDALRVLHATPLELEAGNGLSIRGGDLEHAHDLDSEAVLSFLDAAGTRAWSGRLADVEPDFDAFARRFTRWKDRDARTGGYGRWLNPLGRWDWWDLGGRFDGAITGAQRRGTGNASMISSGPDRNRDLLGGISRALGGRPSEIEAEIEANIEIVSALLEAARRGEKRAFPTAIVLPVRACADEYRWFDDLGWRPIPPETKAFLSVADDAGFRVTAVAAYERFHMMAAAAVAYHF